eukprot:5362157-Amphidinium_carterae.1
MHYVRTSLFLWYNCWWMIGTPVDPRPFIPPLKDNSGTVTAFVNMGRSLSPIDLRDNRGTVAAPIEPLERSR